MTIERRKHTENATANEPTNENYYCRTVSVCVTKRGNYLRYLLRISGNYPVLIYNTYGLYLYGFYCYVDKRAIVLRSETDNQTDIPGKSFGYA